MTRLITRALILLWIGLVLGIVYFVLQLDVLTDWKLTLPKKPIHAGDTIYIESKYTKLRAVHGKAKRYIECEARPDVFVAYLVNEAEADRQQGRGGTGVEIVIPRGISNLPTTCRIRISIEYPVLPFRTVLETTTSDEFTLLPESEESRIKRENETVSVSTPQSSASPAQSSNLPSSSQSTTTTASKSVTNTTTSSQTTEQTTPTTKPSPEPKPEPTILDKIADIIRSIGN